MLEWSQLHPNLERASSRHRQLLEKFERFAKFVEEQVTAPTFHIKGLGITSSLDQGFFSTTFAGRTLQFRFESALGDKEVLVGKVNCYLKKEFPALEYLSIGGFGFTTTGQTTLVDPNDKDPISIDTDIGALHLVIDYIHESLSR